MIAAFALLVMTSSHMSRRRLPPAAARCWALLLFLAARGALPPPPPPRRANPLPRPPSPVLLGLRKVLAGRIARPRRRRMLPAVNAPGRPNAPLAAASGGLISPKEEKAPLLALPSAPNGGSIPSVTGPGLADTSPCLPQSTPLISLGDPLPREATAAQAAHWLEAQRFAAHIRTFGSFSGADLLRLTREDLVQLCGLADGIRLHNALHAKSIAPRLTLYLCVEEQSPVYRALYLHSLLCTEFIEKLAQLIGVPVSQLSDVLLQGPAGIHVLLTDEVIRNFRNEATFTLEVLPDTNQEQYKILLKPTQR